MQNIPLNFFTFSKIDRRISGPLFRFSSILLLFLDSTRKSPRTMRFFNQECNDNNRPAISSTFPSEYNRKGESIRQTNRGSPCRERKAQGQNIKTYKVCSVNIPQPLEASSTFYKWSASTFLAFC